MTLANPEVVEGLIEDHKKKLGEIKFLSSTISKKSIFAYFIYFFLHRRFIAYWKLMELKH